MPISVIPPTLNVDTVIHRHFKSLIPNQIPFEVFCHIFTNNVRYLKYRINKSFFELSIGDFTLKNWCWLISIFVLGVLVLIISHSPLLLLSLSKLREVQISLVFYFFLAKLHNNPLLNLVNILVHLLIIKSLLLLIIRIFHILLSQPSFFFWLLNLLLGLLTHFFIQCT